MRKDVANFNDAFIAADGQPAIIVDTLLARGRRRAPLLRYTSLFREDLCDHRRRISLKQFSRLIRNALCEDPHPELPFILGRQLHSSSLELRDEISTKSLCQPDAVQRLTANWQLVSPLLSSSLRIDDRNNHVIFLDSAHTPEIDRTLLEICLAVITRLISNPDNAPPRIYLPYPQPEHIEQYEVHLRGSLHFDAPFAAVMWPAENDPDGGESTHRDTTLQPDSTEGHGPQQPLLSALRRFLNDNITHRARLSEAADWLETSEATLKRRLAELGFSYQQLLDQCRCQQATFEMIFNQRSASAICDQLDFGDNSNFRRAFKRWTGLTPAGLRDDYLLTDTLLRS